MNCCFDIFVFKYLHGEEVIAVIHTAVGVSGPCIFNYHL